MLKMDKKGKNIWKLDQKCIKYENISVIPLNKLLE